MIKSQLACYLALLKINQFGPKKIALLEQHLDCITDCFKLNAKQLSNLGLNNKYIQQFSKVDWNSIEQDLKWAEKPNQHIISWNDPCYPSLLKQIHYPPPVLFIKGQIQFLNKPCLGIVGSRNPTPQGLDNAYYFSKHLSRAGYSIASGLALGIDGISHQGALEEKSGTIAVIATGVDKIYPAKHRALTQKIIQNGAIISEFPLGTLPKAQHFPRRNRIISGLSRGILVIEASLNSGSLITARYANEQGREVFAIPGSIHNPLAKGCHDIIRQGAKLVDNAEHIVEELPPLTNISAITPIFSKKSALGLEIDQQNLVQYVKYAPTSIDCIISQCGGDVESVSSSLLELELHGVIQSVPGGYIRR